MSVQGEQTSVSSLSQSRAMFKLNAPQATDEAIDDNNSFSSMQEQMERQATKSKPKSNVPPEPIAMPTHNHVTPPMPIGGGGLLPPTQQQQSRERLVPTASRAAARNDDNSSSSSSSEEDERKSFNLRCMIIGGIVAIVLLVGLIVAVVIALTNQGGGDSNPVVGPPENPGTGPDNTPAPTPPQFGTLPPAVTTNVPPSNGPVVVGGTTLLRIFQAGNLNCGVPIEQPGFALTNITTGRIEGFDADLVCYSNTF